MRNVGGLGESTFEGWCHSVGLTVNPSQVDMTGWDYLVEFPKAVSSGQPADLEPPPIECRVQVKSTDRRRGRWDMRLQNLERLAKTPMPAFILVLEFDGLDVPQRAYLIHVGEEIIRRVLKKLREISHRGNASRKKKTITIAYGEPRRLAEPNGMSLKSAIEGYLGEGLHAYEERKKELLDSLGYEDGHGHAKFQISGPDPLGDLIDVSLGLRKSMKIDKYAMYDTRFNVDYELPRPCEGGAELSMKVVPQEGVISFREEEWSVPVDLPVKVHNSSVNRVVPRDRIKLRIESRFFEILVEPFAGRVQFTLLQNVEIIRARLSHICAFLNVISMLRTAGSRGIWMDITIDGKDFLPDGKIQTTHEMHAVGQELRLAKQAVAVARAYNVEQVVQTTLADMLSVGTQISILHNVLQRELNEVTARFFVDEIFPKIHEKSGAIMRVCLPLGGFILYCVIGLVGRLEKIGAREYELTSNAKCLSRCAISKGGKALEESELVKLAQSLQHEMETLGIGPVVILET